MCRSLIKTNDRIIIWDSLPEYINASPDHSQPFWYGRACRWARDYVTTSHLSLIAELGWRVWYWELLAWWTWDGEDCTSFIGGSICELGNAAPPKHQRKQAWHPSLSKRNCHAYKYAELFRGDIAPESRLLYYVKPHGQSSSHQRARPCDLGHPSCQSTDEIWLLKGEKIEKEEFLISKKKWPRWGLSPGF